MNAVCTINYEHSSRLHIIITG